MGFGDFQAQCAQAALPLCRLIGPQSKISGATGMQAMCYARSVEIANTLIFQGATGFVHILALVMTAIMIIHVRSKYTAVGMLRMLFAFDLFIRSNIPC
jgi:chitin synthase III-like protein